MISGVLPREVERQKHMSALPEKCLIPPSSTLKDALISMNESQAGIALVVDENQKLIDAITDGDIRRAMLYGHNIDANVAVLLERRQNSAYPDPITASPYEDDAKLVRLMKEKKIMHLPIVDSERRVVGLKLLRDVIEDDSMPMHAVVMAGGFGSRLQPLTHDTPKPMLKIGDRPLLERIIDQLRGAGINNVSVTTHFMPEKIQDHFGSGEGFGVEINYVNEETPLGTAGALRLLDERKFPLLVMNGDILTNIDFRCMLDFHAEHEAAMTVAVRPYRVEIPYGVVQCSGAVVTGLEEKPTHHYFVNAGIYLLSETAFDHIGDQGRLDMTELLTRLIDADQVVASFPITEYWLDIGQHDDYERAQVDFQAGKLSS